MTTSVANKGAVAVFVVLTLLLIVVIIAYLVWRLNRSNLRAIDIVKDPRQLTAKKSYRFSSSKLPAMFIGQEFSMSFWLYLNDFQHTNLMKLLINRMSYNFDLKGANPVVFLDKTTNKMYISIATSRTSPSPKKSLEDLLLRTGKGANNNWTYLTATIDYVPLQRWVHVAFTVQDNMLTVYQDGSMYTVASLFDMTDPASKIVRPSFAACNGDITIGAVDPAVSSPSTGFIARTQFFNYALTTSQVTRIYGSGPTATNVLRSLGVPDYGVRSPIYRVDDDGGKSVGNG
jgi:hypothetical protein